MFLMWYYKTMKIIEYSENLEATTETDGYFYYIMGFFSVLRIPARYISGQQTMHCLLAVHFREDFSVL